MKQLLLNTNPTKNGRYYTKECLESLMNQINKNKGRIPGTINYTGTAEVPLERTAFIVEGADMENNDLFIDINIIDTPEGKRLTGMLPNVSFRPNVWVDNYPDSQTEHALHLLNGNVRIENATINYVAAIPKSEDAVNF